MTVLWTAAEAAAATNGQATQPFAVTGISIDTRTLQKNDLFVALSAARDGHDFVAEALRKGAGAALVSRRPEGVAPDAPLLIVADVLEGLRALARAARARSKARVVGVTGSVGKTSTKEMLVHVLGRQGVVHAAEKSFNNHWGVPLTLARLPQQADFAVIEIGMNHPGEIAPLAQLADLDAALITTVAAAHLEAFDSVDAIAHEKAAIFSGLRPAGLAVINADLPTREILSQEADAARARIVWFGGSACADFRMTNARLTETATVVSAHCGGEAILFKLGCVGRHFAMNALGVLAVVQDFGVDMAVAAADLAQWQPPDGRGRRETIVLDQVEDHLRFDLIDDAFNANPASMAAALAVLAAASPKDGLGRHRTGRRIAILGDMLELGRDEAALHAEIVHNPAMASVQRVHCVGPRMQYLWQALPRAQRGEWAPTADALAARAAHLADAGDVVLVKGSKGSHVSRVANALRGLGKVLADQGDGLTESGAVKRSATKNALGGATQEARMKER